MAYRSVLIILTGLFSALYPHGSFAADEPIAIDELMDSDSDQKQVHHAALAAGKLCIVSAEGPRSDLSPQLVCRNDDGSKPPAEVLAGQVLDVVVELDGSVATLSRNRESVLLSRRAPTGNLMARSEHSRKTMAMVNAHTWSLHLEHDGTYTVTDTDTGAELLAGQLDTQRHLVSAHRLSDDRFAIVDQVAARLFIGNVNQRTVAEVSFDSEVIDASRKHYAARAMQAMRTAPAGARRPRGQIIADVAATSDGRLFLLISPLKMREGAKVIEIDPNDNFAVETHAAKVLDETGEQLIRPRFLAADAGRYVLISPTGRVAFYRL